MPQSTQIRKDSYIPRNMGQVIGMSGKVHRSIIELQQTPSSDMGSGQLDQAHPGDLGIRHFSPPEKTSICQIQARRCASVEAPDPLVCRLSVRDSGPIHTPCTCLSGAFQFSSFAWPGIYTIWSLEYHHSSVLMNPLLKPFYAISSPQIDALRFR